MSSLHSTQGKLPFTIAVVAPSGAPVDDIAVEHGLQVLAQRGFGVCSYYRPEQKMQRFGASDAQRIEQIYAASENPDVHVVMALRGSYGLSRLLPQLDFERLASSGKIFVGYSDFTPMHMGLLARGRSSLAGPMLCDDFTREPLSDYAMTQFEHCLFNHQHVIEFVDAASQDVEVRGVLWGGNLAMLTHLLGTPYWAEVDQGILFLEDIGEHPYRVERMLLQLHYAGVLAKQKAIVIGDFSGYKLALHDNGYDVNAMLDYVRSVVNVPVLTGLPFGHIRDRATLVVGSHAHLRSVAGQASLSMEYAL
ncbi:LD-carboxypeptidase [Undibacterium sp. SXout7W]|uniref:LD-carboxypeptidase n=1 Tax=Undibacterium sp. SXout7W TaxID=3413049 RepID=UPI003BF35AE1